MSNIIKIVKDDFKKLFSSAISLCVVFGLIAIPTVYSLFNIAGYWDPYSKTSNLEIAIVDEDVGYKTELLPLNIELGKSSMSVLNENTEFKWVVTDYESAMNKLNSGEFYAALIIPENFSQQFIDILSGKAQSTNILYYSNQKNSPITPKLIDTEMNTIEAKINNTISHTIYEAALKTTTQLVNGFSPDSNNQFSNLLVKSFENAKSEIDNFNVQMNTLTGLLDTVDKILEIGNNLLPTQNNDKIEKLYLLLEDVQIKTNISKKYIDNASNILKEYGLLQDFQNLLNEMSNICSNIDDFALTSQNIINDTKNLTLSVADSFNSLKTFSTSLKAELSNLKINFSYISSDLQTAIDRLNALSSSSSVEEIKNILGEDSTEFANLISSPVIMDRHELYPVQNFGTAISGFFVSLSCWAGCLILTTIFSTKLSRKRERKMANLGTYKSWQLYFGRYAIYGLVAILQATVMCLCCIFFLQIKMVNPFLFLMTGIIVSLVFSFFIYTLVASFGSIGKVFAVILLVLQIAASGGTFPIAMVTEIYRYIYPYLPISYTVKAFNMCIAGFSDISVYWQYILIVCTTMITISLVIGLILRVPNIKIAEWFEKKLHSTKLFAI